MQQFSKHKFAVFVKATREKAKLSLRQTAKKSGLTLARCFAIENAEARLNLPQLAALAFAFGFDSGGQFLTQFEHTQAPDKEPRKKKRTKAA